MELVASSTQNNLPFASGPLGRYPPMELNIETHVRKAGAARYGASEQLRFQLDGLMMTSPYPQSHGSVRA